MCVCVGVCVCVCLFCTHPTPLFKDFMSFEALPAPLTSLRSETSPRCESILGCFSSGQDRRLGQSLPSQKFPGKSSEFGLVFFFFLKSLPRLESKTKGPEGGPLCTSRAVPQA